MSEQTEALRLASLIQGRPDNAIIHGDKAAAELIRLEQSSREGWRYSDELEQERKRLEAENTGMERLMLSTVPDRWKSCTSPVGAVQSYIADLETANAELLTVLVDVSYTLEKARIWGGMEWKYNPLHPVHYLPARDKARAAIKKHGGN